MTYTKIPTWQKILLYFYHQNDFSAIISNNPDNNPIYIKLEITEKERRIFIDLVNKNLLEMNFVEKEGKYDKYKYSLTAEGMTKCQEISGKKTEDQIVTNNIKLSGNARYTNVEGPINSTGDIFSGDKIIHQDYNAKEYNIDRKDYRFENASIKITNLFGERKPKIVGLFTSISGALELLISFGSLFANATNLFSTLNWLTIIPKEWIAGLIILGVISIILGLFLIELVNHKLESQCPKCKQFYSLRELEDPLVRDVELKKGTRRTTKTQMGCKNKDCDYKGTKTENEFIPDQNPLTKL